MNFKDKVIVITGAFKTDFEIYTKPLSLPAVWSFANFRKLFLESNIAVPFMNSVIVSAFSVLQLKNSKLKTNT